MAKVVWQRGDDGLLYSRDDRHRVLDAAARGLSVPDYILTAAADCASWGSFTRLDYAATRRSGRTWREILDDTCAGWDSDPDGWVPYEQLDPLLSRITAEQLRKASGAADVGGGNAIEDCDALYD